ncbi:thioredoxin family protein [Kitasatospora sp. DSM 101779]|uniref:thioredoxin family protein n=1 Tax=Kitasatospora sp. DSM 101779 TaxID=2853165 RepID=UPI0021DB5285|nr:thioredoxin family protein [Kitasatospora sp. DSM 101779]MCU7825103.1 thioredoxin family protein [Kitasatospora sp. DSM 101779]
MTLDRRSLGAVLAALTAAASLAACGPADSSDGATAAAPASTTAVAQDLPAPLPSPTSATPTTASPSASAAPSRSATAAASTPAAAAKRVSLAGYNASANAQKEIDGALALAKSDGRRVLLDFGTNECGVCRAVDGLFAKSRIRSTLDASYHVVKIDLENNRTNMAILGRYDSSHGFSTPVIIVVDAKNSVVTNTNRTGLPKLTETGFDGFLRQWAK